MMYRCMSTSKSLSQTRHDVYQGGIDELDFCILTQLKNHRLNFFVVVDNSSCSFCLYDLILVLVSYMVYIMGLFKMVNYYYLQHEKMSRCFEICSWKTSY